MHDLIAYTIFGLVTASIYAIAASGLVVTYTTSGVFNLAHGAVGMFGAFTYWQLRFAWHWPAWLALLVLLGVLAPLFGCVLERVLMRNLSDATEVTKLAVTIGVLVALVGASLWIWDPQTSRPFTAFYAGNKVKVIGVPVTWDQLITIGIGVVCAIGLRLLLYRTRIGLDMRAVVDNRALVLLNGGRPDRASMFSWAIGSSMACLAGILIAPYLQLAALPLTLLVINAYAAAVIGRLRSLAMTAVGAIIIGLLQSYAVGYLPTSTVVWLQRIPDTIPIFVLFIALLLLPHQRLRGGATRRVRESFPVPTFKLAVIGSALLIGLAIVVGPMLGTQSLYSMSNGLALGIIGLSFVPLVGYGGQISLCQMTFAGIGAVVFAHATGSGNLLGLLLAFAVPAMVGALTALPAIRLRGLYLALATAAFAQFCDTFVFGLSSITVFGHKIPLFGLGSLPATRPNFPFLNESNNNVYFAVLAAMFCVIGVGIVALRRSRYGRMLLAMRESPAAASMLGLRLTTVKLGVFSLSAGIAGVGGALLAGLATQFTPDAFSFFQNLPLLLLMMAGGVAMVGGAFFGAVALGLFSSLGSVSSLFNRISALLPGLVGIGLGEQPNGVVADIAGGLSKLTRRGRTTSAPVGAAPAAAADVAWEWAGIDTPLTASQQQQLDLALEVGV
ncbi:MAG TPA: ABC transporter permease [Jatrophihabitantaceae bacterium]|nr:ABC transporter permease [Jatrophihabitantaceae bacterium]